MVPALGECPGYVDVVVIGGGQSALAAGYYLRRVARDALPDDDRGPPVFVLLDGGDQPGGAWVEGWDSLHLFSPAAYSSLPGWPMPAWTGEGNPSADHVRRYLASYEDRYGLPVHRRARVRGVRKTLADQLFGVVTDRGTWTCRVLINATGSWSRPFWPVYPGMGDFEGRQLHTHDYRRAVDFAGQRVVVVGGGNSGAQIAADLIGTAGQVVWVTSRPPRFLPDDVDGRALFEIATRQVRTPAGEGSAGGGVSVLGDIVAVPAVRRARDAGLLTARPMFARLTPSGVGWDDGTTLRVDTIIWCTGFRPELRHLRGLRLTRHGGVPVTDSSQPTRSIDDPALFFLGYGDWCGLASAPLGRARPAPTRFTPTGGRRW